MTCYHPLRRFTIGVNPETGKSLGKVTPYDVDYLTRRGKKFIYGYGSPVRLPYDDALFEDSDVIPCGKCIGCRLDYSRQWTTRLMLELPYHNEAWFLTLTYNDDVLPTNLVDVDGEIKVTHSLVKKDFQNFIKRLRNYFPDKSISYYCCGEYGSRSFRPHYHAILFFDSPLQDYVFPSGDSNKNVLHKVQDGYFYFINPLIDKLWYRSDMPDRSAGFHYITQVNWDTCAYVTQYVTKKLNGSAADVYDRLHLEPEFSLISQKPALGRRYYDEHKDDIYTTYFIGISSNSKYRQVKPPRYYDNLFDVDNHDTLQVLKEERRSIAEDRISRLLLETDLSYSDYLSKSEESFKAGASLRMKAKYKVGRRI
ncbi:replication initiator protein [Capybara microvirus Cap1_SP_192]|nr:replication initiator protein [Capybara microvirus Cap1_SP_192]